MALAALLLCDAQHLTQSRQPLVCQSLIRRACGAQGSTCVTVESIFLEGITFLFLWPTKAYIY